MCAGLAMAGSKRLTGLLHAIVADGIERDSVSRGRLIWTVLAASLSLIPISMTARVTIAAETEGANQAVLKPEATQKPVVDIARSEQRGRPAVADAANATDPYDTLYDAMEGWQSVRAGRNLSGNL
jgi:hypothetical protein